MTRSIGGMYQRNGIWWITFTADGCKVRESTRSTRQKDARALLQQRIAEITDGRYTPDSDRLTFAELEVMIRDHYRGMRSENRALGSLPHLRRHLGLYQVKAISFDRLNAFINARLDEGAARASIRYDLAILRVGLRIAVRSGRLVKMPEMPSMKIENTRSGFFEPADFRAVRAELPVELRGVVEVGYWTGWRIRSELLPMQWSQIDLEAGTMRLEPCTTKNGKGRTFPVDTLPQLYDALKAQREYTDAIQRKTGQIIPHVFHNNGKPIQSFYKAWRSACKRAGLEGKLQHDFRRTAVRNLERAGVSRSTGMQLTGHLTESVYHRYAIVAESDLRDGVAKLAVLDMATDRKVLPFSGTSRTQKQAANA